VHGTTVKKEKNLNFIYMNNRVQNYGIKIVYLSLPKQFDHQRHT